MSCWYGVDLLSLTQNINVWSVLAATGANFVFSGVYFGVIIKNPYKYAMGREKEPDQKPEPIVILGPMVCNLFITISNAILLKALDIRNMNEALSFGFLIGTGYQLPMTMMIAINPNFPRPFYYFAIHIPYFVLTSLMTCSILTMK